MVDRFPTVRMKSARVIQGHTGSYRVIQGHTGSYRSLKGILCEVPFLLGRLFFYLTV